MDEISRTYLVSPLFSFTGTCTRNGTSTVVGVAWKFSAGVQGGGSGKLSCTEIFRGWPCWGQTAVCHTVMAAWRRTDRCMYVDIVLDPGSIPDWWRTDCKRGIAFGTGDGRTVQDQLGGKLSCTENYWGGKLSCYHCTHTHIYIRQAVLKSGIFDI